MVDTGLDLSVISTKTIDKIQDEEVQSFSTKDCTPLQSVSGHKLMKLGSVVLDVQIARFKQPFKFLIVQGLKHECILGHDFFSEFNVQLDFGHDTMNIGDDVIPLHFQRSVVWRNVV